MKAVLKSTICVLSAICVLATNAISQTPDLTFGSSGFVMFDDWPYTSFDGGTIQNNRLLLKSNNNIIGHSLSGVMDFDFGDNGVIDGEQFVWEWGQSNNLQTAPNSISTNSSYSVLVASAYEYDQQFNPTNERLVFQYFNNNGAPATNLPNSGALQVPFEFYWTPSQLEFSPDNSKGYLYYQDTESPPTQPDSLCIISITENGTINAAWGNNGITYLNYASIIPGFTNLVKLCPTNDKVYILIQYNNGGNQYCVIRFNATGQYDSSFGVKSLTQTLSIQINDEVQDMVITGESTVVLAKNRKIYKLNTSDFTLDNAFGVSGVATASPLNGQYTKLRIVDSKIYGIGSTLSSGINKPLITRHVANGSIDNSFGSNGSITENWPQFVDESAFLDIIPSAPALYVAGKSFFISQSGNDDYQDDFVVKYNFNDPTTIEEDLFEDKVVFFPNPVNSVLNVGGLNFYSYKIYNSMGQIVLTGNGNSVNCENLLSGYYTIELQGMGKAIRKSFIKL